MTEPIQTLVNALERDDGGLAIVLCPDLKRREWLVGDVESIVPTRARAFRTDSAEDALKQPDRLALLVPSNERDVVLDLDACRDQALDPARSQPIVLFLVRGGDGYAALASEAPSLWSWACGSDVDPEQLAEVDISTERTVFEQTTGKTPERWLASWIAGEMPRTSANYSLAYRAKLLELR
jgi:hypothetical protein